MNKKTCPFCGKDKIVIYMSDEDNCSECPPSTRMFSFICDMRAGGCGASSGYYDTEEEALEKWNRRVNSLINNF